MKKLAPAFVLILFAACASSQAAKDAAEDVPTPPPPGPTVDQRLTEMQTQMTELLERLDVMSDRIARVEQGSEQPAAAAPVVAAAAPAVSAPAAAAPAPAEPRVSRAIVGAQIADSYRAALMLYGRGKLADSRKAFQQVYDSDPSGELADNALYWIGETFFATSDYTNAIKYFRRVTTDYGDQNKAPDAAYKTGVALEKSGDLQLAKQAFDECIKRYPYSTSAASAKQALERIKF
jgi:tol-pal system protein YbgF